MGFRLYCYITMSALNSNSKVFNLEISYCVPQKVWAFYASQDSGGTANTCSVMLFIPLYVLHTCVLICTHTINTVASLWMNLEKEEKKNLGLPCSLFHHRLFLSVLLL